MELFKEELERLNELDIKIFTENALKCAPDSFKEDKNAILHTKKVFRIVEELLNSDEVKGQVRDVILAGVLLSDLAVNEERVFTGTHPFLVRPLLKDIQDDLIPQLYEGIMRIVEKHEGKDTLITDIHPKPGSPEHLVAIANVIARSDSIQVNV